MRILQWLHLHRFVDFCLFFVSTGDVLQWLSGNATKSLDILAQYWQFLAHPNNPKSGVSWCGKPQPGGGMHPPKPRG